MRIALDYDGTYTADPDLWDKFINSCRDKHDVWIDDNPEWIFQDSK